MRRDKNVDVQALQERQPDHIVWASSKQEEGLNVGTGAAFLNKLGCPGPIPGA